MGKLPPGETLAKKYPITSLGSYQSVCSYRCHRCSTSPSSSAAPAASRFECLPSPRLCVSTSARPKTSIRSFCLAMSLALLLMSGCSTQLSRPLFFLNACSTTLSKPWPAKKLEHRTGANFNTRRHGARLLSQRTDALGSDFSVHDRPPLRRRRGIPLRVSRRPRHRNPTHSRPFRHLRPRDAYRTARHPV